MEKRKWARVVRREDRESNPETIPVSFKMPRHQNSNISFLTFLGIHLLKESTNKCGEFQLRQLFHCLPDSNLFSLLQSIPHTSPRTIFQKYSCVNFFKKNQANHCLYNNFLAWPLKPRAYLSSVISFRSPPNILHAHNMNPA